MKAPGKRVQGVSSARRKKWIETFSSYKSVVGGREIDDWLEQFQQDGGHRDVGARLLDAVDYYSVPRIHAAYRELLPALDGWNANPNKREGHWRFCEFSGGAGSSSGAMLYNFRSANKLAGAANAGMFILRSEIVQQQLGENDKLVMVDDFVGTGRQACAAYEEFFMELLSGIGTVYLVIVAGYKDGIDRIQNETGINVVAGRVLGARDSLANAGCRYFNGTERSLLKKYGKMASDSQPMGFGGLGLSVVFSHNCPNNSAAVLHKQSKKWAPLFPRH